MTNEQETRTGGLFKELVIMFGLIGLLVTLLTGVGALYWMQSQPGTAAAGTPATARPAESARLKTVICEASSGTSSGRARRGGSQSTRPLRRNHRSSRNQPSATPRSRSRLLA